MFILLLFLFCKLYFSYLPSVINMFTSGAIVLQLSRASQKRAAMSSKKDAGSLAAEAEVRKITITVLSISFTYLLLTVPLAIW